MNAVQLAVEISSRAATQGFDGTADAAKNMAREVESSTRAAAGGLGRVADSADNLDSKMSSATSALGALSSGFELVGA